MLPFLLSLSSSLFAQALPPLPFADPSPSVILRGQSARLTVKGRDLASLQSLKIEPPGGLLIRSISPLPATPGTPPSVTVEITADPNAALGERRLMLSLPSNVTLAESKRQSAPPDQQLDAFRQSIAKNHSSSIEAGSIYVNSHSIAITNLSVSGNQTRRLVRFTATDPAGDFAVDPPPANPSSAIQLVTAPAWLISEARCGADLFDSPITQAVIASRQPSSATIAAQLDMDGLPRSCTLFIRLRDAAGNTSDWSVTKLP